MRKHPLTSKNGCQELFLKCVWHPFRNQSCNMIKIDAKMIEKIRKENSDKLITDRKVQKFYRTERVKKEWYKRNAEVIKTKNKAEYDPEKK